MSIWRRKRRYEENRRFSERADSALLAIGLIRNSADGIESTREDEDLRQKLSEGRELLEELRLGLRNPEQVDAYTVALAHRLCDLWKIVPSDAIDRLSTDIEVVSTLEETLSTTPRIRQTAKTLEDVEDVASRISETEAEEIRNSIIN